MVRSDPHPSPQEQFRAPWKAEGWVGRGEGETGRFTCREPVLGSLSSRFTCAAIAVGAGGGWAHWAHSTGENTEAQGRSTHSLDGRAGVCRMPNTL